jgi:hypothetical protein
VSPIRDRGNSGTHTPRPTGYPHRVDNVAAALDRMALAQCIDACLECTRACTSCADACLNEESHVAELAGCIRLDQNCADICDTTARVLIRSPDHDMALTRRMLDACIQACRSCGDECERHAGAFAHCRVCAEACRRCERACQELLNST